MRKNSIEFFHTPFYLCLTYMGDIIIMNVVFKTTLNGVEIYDI